MCVFFQGDGREEVVACAWDGQTYIIDHNRTVVRFQFDENVNAFCAGERTQTLPPNNLQLSTSTSFIYIYIMTPFHTNMQCFT